MLNQIKLPKAMLCTCYNIITNNYSSLSSLYVNKFSWRHPLCLRNYSLSRVNTAILENSLVRIGVKLTIMRHKFRGKSNKSGIAKRADLDNDDSDDDDDDDEDEDESDNEELQGMKNVKEKTYNLASLRMDSILKTTLELNRKKIEEAFYNVNIRVNGKVPLKKSLHAEVGDEIDVVKGFAKVNPNFITVSRVEILKVNVDEENNTLLVKVRKSKNLLVENYPEGHSWKQSGGDRENY